MINDLLGNTENSDLFAPAGRLLCHNLACERGGRGIFQHLGFSLQAGSLLILKGPNGSGKTSLLKMLATLLPPAHGSITWNGTPITHMPSFRNGLTYIGHKNGLKGECTVEENLVFYAKLTGSEILLPVALRYFGLEKKRHIACHLLSAGWQRRVALSRLLLMPTPIWLLDEPTNFLDEEAIILFTNLVETRVTQGGIVVIASHSMSSSFASHTLLMEDFSPC